jgi:creatinine amidohydrolase
MTYRYERLTWPEARQAAVDNKVCILPVGSVEQHGPHLPLDVDIRLPTEIAHATARANSHACLVLPTFQYGYTGHVMDYPGTINTNYDTMIEAVLDVGRSLAYHGFRNIILLNGHGSNTPVLDLVARRINLETPATCAFTTWWRLLTIEPDFLPGWRDSVFPGGCAHACELETAVYLHIDEDAVRKELIEDDLSAVPTDGFAKEALWVDLFATGAVATTTWTSRASKAGVFGQPSLATKEKGARAFDEAVRQLTRLVDHMRDSTPPPRADHHAQPAPMAPAWKEQPIGLGLRLTT